MLRWCYHIAVSHSNLSWQSGRWAEEGAKQHLRTPAEQWTGPTFESCNLRRNRLALEGFSVVGECNVCFRKSTGWIINVWGDFFFSSWRLVCRTLSLSLLSTQNMRRRRSVMEHTVVHTRPWLFNKQRVNDVIAVWFNANMRATCPKLKLKHRLIQCRHAPFTRVQFNLFVVDESKTTNEVSENGDVGHLWWETEGATVSCCSINIVYAQLMHIAWARPTQ